MSIADRLKSLFARKIQDSGPVRFSYTPGPIRITDHAHQQERGIKPKVANPVLGYKEGVRSKFLDEYEYVEYDLGYILRAEDTEAYLRQAHEKKITLFFKEGYTFSGENEETVTYIKKRFRQIAEATNISTDRLLRAVATDLIKVSNCFLYLVRDADKSGGKTVDGVKPIAGIFPVPAETILVKTTNSGQVVSVKQKMLNGKEKIYNKKDMFHLATDRKNGFTIGTPRTWPAIEDILALRRLEENIEKLLHRDLFPIYQYKVGTETMPCKVFPGGSTEIDEVKAMIREMPPEGIYVTPERHEIKVIGHEGRALRAEGYLKHFKQRVLSGMGMSSVDMGEGEGASKSSAETMSQGLIDEVKGYQMVTEDLVNSNLIRALLLESTFSYDTTADENMVYLKFKEIDKATQIKIENHNAQLFQQNAINHDELMIRMGRTPADDEWWATSFWKLIEEPKALILASDEPFSPASQALAEADNTAIQPEQLTKAQAERDKAERVAAKAKASTQGRAAQARSSRGARSGAASDRPANQHGRKLEPISRTNSLEMKDFSQDQVFEIFRIARSDAVNLVLTEDVYWRRALLNSAKQEFKTRFSTLLNKEYRAGYNSQLLGLTAGSVASYSILEAYVDKYVDRIFNDIQKAMLPVYTKETVGSIFDSIEYRISFLMRTELVRAKNYGVLIALREQHYTQARFERCCSDVCEDCDRMTQDAHDLSMLGLDSIPPHHPNCECKIKGVINGQHN